MAEFLVERIYLTSSPIIATPKCSQTTGQNLSRHVMKSSSMLKRKDPHNLK